MGKKAKEVKRVRGAREATRENPIQGSGEIPSVQNGYHRTSDGTRIFYSQEGSGKLLIFCYGLVCSSLHWTYQLDYFRKNYKTLWFDYRGHANSDVPNDLRTLTIAQLAKDLISLLDEIGEKKAVFFGHSMGVNVVLECYRQRPDLFEGMVLSSGTARTPLESLFGTNATEPVFQLSKKLYDFSPSIMKRIWKLNDKNPLLKTLIRLGGFNPYLTPKEDVEKYVDQILKMEPGVFLNLMDDYRKIDSSAWLHQVKAPTLVIAGEKDYCVPLDEQEKLHQLIPNSEYLMIRHGSHCPQMDLPDLFNLKVYQFLKEIGYSSGSSEVEAPITQSTQGKSQSTQSSSSRPFS